VGFGGGSGWMGAVEMFLGLREESWNFQDV
jgi:hypothetical protein